MDNNYIYDMLAAMAERTNKRLWILCLALLTSLVISNVGWVIYESQYVTESTTTVEAEQDGEGNNNIVNGGDYISESESKDNNHN